MDRESVKRHNSAMLLPCLTIGILLLDISPSSGGHLSRANLTKNHRLADVFQEMRERYGNSRQTRSRSKRRCGQEMYRNAADGNCYQCMSCRYPDVVLSPCKPSSDTVCGLISSLDKSDTKGNPSDEEPIWPNEPHHDTKSDHVGIIHTTVKTVSAEQPLDIGDIGDEQSDQPLISVNRKNRRKRECKRRHKTRQKCKRDGSPCKKKKKRSCGKRKRKRNKHDRQKQLKSTSGASRDQLVCSAGHYYNETIRQCHPCTECPYHQNTVTSCAQTHNTVCSPFPGSNSSAQVRPLLQGHEIPLTDRSSDENSTQPINRGVGSSVRNESQISQPVDSLRRRNKRAACLSSQWMDTDGMCYGCKSCQRHEVEMEKCDARKDTVCGLPPGELTTKVSQISKSHLPARTEDLNRLPPGSLNTDGLHISSTGISSKATTPLSLAISQTEHRYHATTDDNVVGTPKLESAGVHGDFQYTFPVVVSVVAFIIVTIILFLIVIVLLKLYWTRSKQRDVYYSDSSLPPECATSPETTSKLNDSTDNFDNTSSHADIFSNFTSLYGYNVSPSAFGPSVSHPDLRPRDGGYVVVPQTHAQYIHVYPQTDKTDVEQISNAIEV